MAHTPPSRDRHLRLRFGDAAGFAREYQQHISRGGAFVPGALGFELRELVQVVLELGWCGESIQLEAEVVHVIPRELAAAGATAGVAVQFLLPAPELRSLLGRFVAPAAAEAKPDSPPAASGALAHHDTEDAAFVFGSAEPAGSPGALELFDAPAPEDFDPTLREIEPPPPSKPDGAVRARRRITRVLVRLATADAVLEGRTRDISQSGVLVAVDGNDVPVGTPVRLTLRDPLSGACLDVEGTVARHVLGEGTVSGLGIHFEVGDERRPEVASFVDRLWQTDHVRRLGGIRGEVSEVGLANLLQVLSQSTPCGTLTVSCGGEEGVVAFEGSSLRYARLGSRRGVKALVRMLAWSEGSFEFHAHVDALEEEDTRECLERALLEALRQIDEASHEQARAPDLGARLCVDGDPVGGGPEGLGTIELAVVDLARAGMTLRRVLDVIPEPDAHVLRAVESLRERGILTLDPRD